MVLVTIYEMKVCVWDLEYENIKNSKGIFVPFPHIPRSSYRIWFRCFLMRVFFVRFNLWHALVSQIFFFFLYLFGKYTTPFRSANVIEKECKIERERGEERGGERKREKEVHRLVTQIILLLKFKYIFHFILSASILFYFIFFDWNG